MLEQLRPTVAYIYNTLIKRFRGENLSLSTESQEIRWVLNVLISEMAIGYQRLLFNLAKKEPNWLNGKRYTLLAQRTAYYLGERIYLSYLLSTSTPDRVWLELNATYAYAKKLKLNTIYIKDDFAYFGSKKGSIDCVYKRILLLSLVSPYSLRSAELEQIYYGLLPWLNCINLVHVAEPVTNAYVLDFKQDSGPVHQEAILDGDCRIDCTKLVNKLNTWLDDGDIPESISHKGMSKKLLMEIVTQLGDIKNRGDERLYNLSGQVEVVVGLQDIDVFLGHIKSLISIDEDNDSPIYNDDKDESVWLGQDEFSHNGTDFNSSSAQTTLEEKQEDAQEGKGSHHEIRQHVFDIENESERGVCLSCNYIHGTGLYLGELMFMRGFDPEVWTLGIIRWMLVQNKELKIGLYLFSAQVEQVVISDTGSAVDVNALLLGGCEHGDTVLLPSAEFKVGDELQLNYKGDETDITLGDVVWKSEGFSQFGLIIQEAKLEETTSGEENDFLIPAWAK